MYESRRQSQYNMESHQREDIDVLRFDAYRVPIRNRRNLSWSLPFRVLASWISFVRSQYRTMGRQKVMPKEVIQVKTPRRLQEVITPIEIQLTCKSRVKKWAFDNAYTLIFLSCMFVITWCIIVVRGL